MPATTGETAAVTRGRNAENQKASPIEEEPACPPPPADDAECVGGVAILRPRLCQIGSTSLYMGKRCKRRIPARSRVEPAAPFVCLAPPRRFNGLPGSVEHGLATRRDEILIEK